MHEIKRGDGFMLTSEQKASGAVAQQPANDNSWLSQLTAPVVNFGRVFTAAAKESADTNGLLFGAVQP
jgi:hypothetical protein